MFGISAGSARLAIASAEFGELSRTGARASLGVIEPEGEGETAEPELSLEAATPFLKGWEGSLQFGLNGSTGNSEELDIVGIVDAKRETDKNLTVLGARFNYGTSEGDETDNDFTAQGRHSWKFVDARWRFYIEGRYEYDEFADWDHRISFGPGVEFQAIKNDSTELLLRAGGQVRKDIGGEEDSWTPEAVVGFNATHQLTERQSLEAGFSFFPALDTFGPYRFVGDLGWRIEVDPESKLFLRLGLHSEYDSSPGPDRKRNDLDYYATLGWSF